MVVSKSKDKNYLTEVSDGLAFIESDVTKDKGGSGESFRPHDLLCAALASCMNISVRMVLDRLNLNCDGVTVKVDLDRKDDSTDFIYNIDIVGDISEKRKQEVIRLAENCPIRRTLSKELNFRSSSIENGL